MPGANQKADKAAADVPEEPKDTEETPVDAEDVAEESADEDAKKMDKALAEVPDECGNAGMANPRCKL